MNFDDMYHYNLEKLKNFVIKENGIWEDDEPPTGIIVYLEGTVVHIGNDLPYISFEGDIEVARKVHHNAMECKEELENGKN